MKANKRLDNLEKLVGSSGDDQVIVITWGDGDDMTSEKLPRQEFLRRYGREPAPGVSVDWSGDDEVDNP